MLLQDVVALHVGVTGQRADGDMVTLVAHVVQVAQASDVHEHRRGCEPELHDRQEGVAAGEELGVLAVLLEKLDGVVYGLGDLVVERDRYHRGSPPGSSTWSVACGGRPERSASRSPAAPPVASLIVRHTFQGETGLSMCVTPKWLRASITELMTATGEPMVPASPMPLTPMTLLEEGVTVRSRVKFGS